MKMLAGDIGGTHTRLICAEKNGGGSRTIAEKSYYSADYSDLYQVIDVFLSEHNINKPVQAACFAVAGPVESGAVRITNLPWVVSEEGLRRSLQILRVVLINDFVGVAYGISELKDTDVQVLHQGRADDNIATCRDSLIMGAGTGLGGSHRVWLNNRYYGFASEIGHAGFAPGNEQQDALLAWLREKHPHVSQEMLLSGRGLFTIYCYLHKVCGFPESAEIGKTIEAASDPAQVITACAVNHKDELCQKTVELFVDIYGAIAGNVALHYYPIGELYIAGGIAPKIREYMVSQRFVDAFGGKGTMSSNMGKISIKMILQEKAGLFGALACARTLQ